MGSFIKFILNALKKGKKTTGAVAVVAIVSGGFILNERSLNNLAPTSPNIQAVTKCAAETPMEYQGKKLEFVVYHGLRTDEEQREMIARGVSWVNRSKHQDGKAIDVMARWGGVDTWKPKELYYEIAKSFYACGDKLNIPITWGGEWRVQDLVHFEERNK